MPGTCRFMIRDVGRRRTMRAGLRQCPTLGLVVSSDRVAVEVVVRTVASRQRVMPVDALLQGHGCIELASEVRGAAFRGRQHRLARLRIRPRSLGPDAHCPTERRQNGQIGDWHVQPCPAARSIRGDVVDGQQLCHVEHQVVATHRRDRQPGCRAADRYRWRATRMSWVLSLHRRSASRPCPSMPSCRYIPFRTDRLEWNPRHSRRCAPNRCSWRTLFR